MAWYDLPITNPFGPAGGEPQVGGHSGIDIGMPNNTPLTMPMSGTVIDAQYKPWGGQVAVATNGGVIEYMLHLNDINVKVGDQISANTVVGSSGGGVGDKIKNAAGNIITVVSQGQYGWFSTGYHTHFGLVKGSTDAQFNQSLGQNINRIDPTFFIETWKGKGNVAAASTLGISESPTRNGGSQLVNQTQTATLDSPLDPILTPAITAFEGGASNLMAITLLVVVAIVSLVVGLMLLTGHSDQSQGTSTIDKAMTVAKVAAIA